jgi:imidazolonepropionase-like amidohydrolase
MKTIIQFFTAIILLSMIQTNSILAGNPVVIENVTIINSLGTPELPNRTVLISNGIIQKIIKGELPNIPENAKIIDGTGKYLIPGLIDSHVHLTYSDSTVLNQFLNYGIMCIRDMGGNEKSLNRWKQQVKNGSLDGPEIMLAGPAIETGTFFTVVQKIDQILNIQLKDAILPTRIQISETREIDSIIKKLYSEKVDFIKIRSVQSKNVYIEILKKAKKYGLDVCGHEPMVVSLQEASLNGQKSIEHIPFLSLMDSSAEGRRKVFHEFKSNDTWVVPTILAIKNYRMIPDSIIMKEIDYLENTNNVAITSKLVDFWKMQMKIKQLEGALDWNKLYKQGIEDLRILYDIGVKVMAGTDFSIPLVYPGLGLHEELELMVEEAGFTPLDALRCATINPAIYFKMEEKWGSIEEGKIANIIILYGNPLEKISNTKKIKGIIKSGKYINHTYFAERDKNHKMKN